MDKEKKFAIQCTSEEQAQELLQLLTKKYGYEWDDIKTTYWDYNKEYTCYDINDGYIQFGSGNYYIQHDFPIVLFSDLASELEKYDLGIQKSTNKTYKNGLTDAWKLALELRYMDYEDKLECFNLKHDGNDKWVEIMEKYNPVEVQQMLTEYNKSKTSDYDRE